MSSYLSPFPTGIVLSIFHLYSRVSVLAAGNGGPSIGWFVILWVGGS